MSLDLEEDVKVPDNISDILGDNRTHVVVELSDGREKHWMNAEAWAVVSEGALVLLDSSGGEVAVYNPYVWESAWYE